MRTGPASRISQRITIQHELYTIMAISLTAVPSVSHAVSPRRRGAGRLSFRVFGVGGCVASRKKKLKTFSRPPQKKYPPLSWTRATTMQVLAAQSNPPARPCVPTAG